MNNRSLSSDVHLIDWKDPSREDIGLTRPTIRKERSQAAISPLSVSRAPSVIYHWQPAVRCVNE